MPRTRSAEECLLAPLGAFLLPSHWRLPSVGLAMVLLHLGIGAVQSGAIGRPAVRCRGSWVAGFLYVTWHWIQGLEMFEMSESEEGFRKG